MSFLCSVFASAVLSTTNTCCIKFSSYDMEFYTRKVFNSTASDEYDAVFLEVMTFTRNVAHDFEAVGEANLGHLAERRVRLLRRGGVDARANAALLRASLHRRDLVTIGRRLAGLANELVDRRHCGLVSTFEPDCT